MKTALNALKAIFYTGGLLLLSIAFTRSWQGLAPLQTLLMPNTGYWLHQPTSSKTVQVLLEEAVVKAGLPKVTLWFDEDEVPHLESESDDALYFAQGFITSYFRLWQMDFISRVSAGRISELVGPKALPIDRFFHRMRVPAAAKASHELMMGDSVTRGPLEAFARGVNAHIAGLDETTLPVEYKLFGLHPEEWTTLRAANLLKYMTWDLTAYLYDFKMTETKTRIGHELFELLFTPNPKLPGSIIRGNRKTASFDDPDDQASRDVYTPVPVASWLPGPQDIPREVQPDESNGSNNWTVPARMMANDRALLANDLHLGYTLPALWFPIQLTTPRMNVYGASLPGAPGVIVGFTESMGWAVTNGSDDVLDWYSLRFRDEKRQEYLFEDSWRPVVVREETIGVAHGPSEIVRVRDTHMGPIVFEPGDDPAVVEIPAGIAVQWMGHTASNELKSFLMLNRADEAKDCHEALKEYVSPSQNFLCTDRKGKQIYKHAGRFPDRRGRDGRIVQEASRSQDLWQGLLPIEKTPTLETSTEPIISANQAPFIGERLSDFGWFYTPPFRSLEIENLLNSKKRWKPEEMVELQADRTSLLGLKFKAVALREIKKPLLADAIKKVASRCAADQLEKLNEWNGSHDAKNTVAPLIHRWFRSLEESTWIRLIGTQDKTYWPNAWRLMEFVENEPQAAVWNDASTPANETLTEQLARSFEIACDYLHSNFGSGKVAWSEYQKTSIRHVGRLPGLGRKRVPAGGVAESVFANKGEHGPTWKMIVSFEDKPRAWMMIPGGQSGDPASNRYDNLVDDWAKGEMRPVHFKMRGETKSADKAGKEKAK